MDASQYLTPHFKLREFLWSDTAGRESELSADPKLARVQLLAILEIAKTLEIVREFFGKPIRVLSGFRDRGVHELLQATGGEPSSRSDHSYFSEYNPFGVGAADFYVEDVPIRDVYLAIVARLPEARYGQAILYEQRGFIHLSNPADLLLAVRGSKERLLQKVPGGYEVFRA